VSSESGVDHGAGRETEGQGGGDGVREGGASDGEGERGLLIVIVIVIVILLPFSIAAVKVKRGTIKITSKIKRAGGLAPRQPRVNAASTLS
jgi:hypothetical protein